MLKRHAIGLVAGAMLWWAVPAGAQEPNDLRDAWIRATPTQRLHVSELLADKYPDLPVRLHAHLAAKYPDLELKAARALLTFHDQHPGLGLAVARDLLQDLSTEPAEAALDVARAVTAKYPDLPQRMRALRRGQGGLYKIRELIVSHYPGLRTEFLTRLSQLDRPPEPDLRAEARHVIRTRHHGLPARVFLEVSRLMDESYPGLPMEILKAGGQGQKPLAFLVEHHPDFLQAAAERVLKNQGQELHQAAVDVLTRVEEVQRQRGPSVVGHMVLEMLQTKYPGLAREAVTARLQAAQEMRAAMRREFPELPQVVAATMQARHPQLLSKAWASLEQHHPQLLAQVAAVVEAELPGLRQEVHSYLSAQYPDLRRQVEQALHS